MTTVPTISNAVSNVAQPAPNAVSSNATLSSDFETFLEMLTAQARFQDPLDPISSSDYAAQLAQFSMVEQQVFTNDQLGRLNTTFGGTAINALSSWIGMEARAVSSIRFDGTPITVYPTPSDGADRAELVVYNDFGSEVARRDIPASNTNYIWTGQDQTGRMLGTGTYRFAVDSFANGDLIASEPAQVYARVLEAQVADGDTVLKLAGGATVPASQITALRAPD